MTESRQDPNMQLDEDRLRTSLAGMAPAAPSTGVLERVRGRVERRRHRFRSGVALCALAVAAGGVALGLEFTTGIRTASPPESGRSVAPATSTPGRRLAGPTYAPVHGADGTARSAPGPVPPPCPANVKVPTFATGRYCGPVPGPGDGLGTDGLCTGNEAGPPCGAGAGRGHLYPYTLPGSCDGLTIFDGGKWVVTLTSPTPVAPFRGWIQLERKDLAVWIAPDGAIGLVPYTGQALGTCRG